MRLRVQIPTVKPKVMRPVAECPYGDCDGRWFKLHQQHCDKAVRDMQYDQVQALRRKCLSCGRTHRVYPQGVSHAQQTDRVKGLSTLLYLLGISYRGVEDVFTAMGFYVSHATVWRNVQAAGEKARQLRQAWLARSGGVRVVGGDLTYVRCRGQEMVVGLVVDAQQDITLDIKVLDNQETETLKAWLLPLLELVGAKDLLTDDADGFKEVADAAGVNHLVCRRHVSLNVLSFIAKAAEQVLKKPPAVPPELDVTPEQLLADLETLEWIVLGQPGHAAQLLKEMYLRYAPAPSPQRGKRATLWYRMRNRILHLWDHWHRLTRYLTLKHHHGLELDGTNNSTERAIGWSVKERYRTMRGYKRISSILNVTALTAWLRDQSPGYDMSPIFAA